MESFRIQIAGLVTQVQPLYETTAVYCRNYLTDKMPAFEISITEEDLAFEQRMLDIEAREEGMKLRRFTGPFLERTAIQRKIAEELLKYGTLLMHGSTVGLDGAAYLFTATCGTGKSTHTRLWREVFGDRAVMINDDKPFLKIGNDGVVACGSPWSGKHGLDHNIGLPLKGICILRRGAVNRIRRITPEEAKDMVYHQCQGTADAGLQERICTLADLMMQKIPLWEMECTKEPGAALVSYSAMSREG